MSVSLSLCIAVLHLYYVLGCANNVLQSFGDFISLMIQFEHSLGACASEVFNYTSTASRTLLKEPQNLICPAYYVRNSLSLY